MLQWKPASPFPNCVRVQTERVNGEAILFKRAQTLNGGCFCKNISDSYATLKKQKYQYTGEIQGYNKVEYTLLFSSWCRTLNSDHCQIK